MTATANRRLPGTPEDGTATAGRTAIGARGYPPASRQDLADELHGRLVPDPYRWLEDPRAGATQAWLAAQDALCAEYLARLPAVDALAGRIADLDSGGMLGAPVWRGNRYFFLKRGPRQEHPALWTGTPAAGQQEVLLDPAALDPGSTTTLDRWEPDQEGRLLAYQLSAHGSEESELWVMDVQTATVVDGPISRCRYSDVAWLPGEQAFYYARGPAADAAPGGEQHHHWRVYLHEVGAPPATDKLVFGDCMPETSRYSVSVSGDGRWLIIGATTGTSHRNDIWLADLAASPPERPEFRSLQAGLDARTHVRTARDGRLYLLTDWDAPRGRLMVADPAVPEPRSWRELLPQDPAAILTGFAILDGPGVGKPVLAASWQRHAAGEITTHALADGKRLANVPLPGLGMVGPLHEKPEGGPKAWFTYRDCTTPAAVLCYDIRSRKVSTWGSTPAPPAVPAVHTQQISFGSADGTIVHMLLLSPGTRDEEEAPRRPRPAVLFGYGGFGISMTPHYSASALAWVEAGGIWAVAQLRGGGEEGEEWHQAGTRERKQRVFDDFYAAIGKLITDGWTTPAQLAVFGDSNGGLLVGAAITQRPELFAAAVCINPLADMIRYEQFGLGRMWADEYGSAADAAALGWLLSYSPYHHVEEGIRYPAVLFAVADGDTRVDPMHGRKMCAALQHATSAEWPDAPIILRSEAGVGHGARASSRTVALSAHVLAFAAYHTGLRVGSQDTGDYALQTGRNHAEYQ